MHGNVWSWCQEQYKVYPRGPGERANDDKEDDLIINAQASRVLRGGSFGHPASLVRSAARLGGVPTNRSNYIGFRVARTLFHE
jgi:formylglycine-generating enzyme required for sulfatase activity